VTGAGVAYGVTASGGASRAAVLTAATRAQEHLLLAGGRDITDMMPSYHPFTSKPWEMLAKFEIGELQGPSEFPQFKRDSGVYREMRERVGEYFRRTGKDPKDPVPGLLRLAAIMTVGIASILYVYDTTQPRVLRVLAAVVFGVCQALPLLHCMHDASHTSIGRRPWMWSVIGRLTMDWFAGASLKSWHHQHVVGHHLYTNVMGVDPDLPVTKTGDIRRVSKLQQWAVPYQFQHIYLLFLYSLLGLKFRVQDILGLATGANGSIRVNVTLSDWTSQIVTKSFWFCWRVLLPLVYLAVPPREYLALFLVSEFVTGWYLTLNFQVSHVSPPADFPDSTAPFEDEWAVSQVRTTVDYSHGDPVMTFLCGALNYQTVHHLFPSVSQYHYPAIAPIIIKVCADRGIKYNHVGTFWTALGMHFEHLRNMGRPPHAHH
jgi:fatty acid desaturase